MGEQRNGTIRNDKCKRQGLPPKRKRGRKRKEEKKKDLCKKRGKKIRKVENEGLSFLVSCLVWKKQRSYIKKHLVRV